MSLLIKNVFKSFDQIKVLRDVSLEVNKNEIVALMGPSGSGKTTLLRCISSLENIDQGTISIDDICIIQNENKSRILPSKAQFIQIRQKLGLVFQNYQLFPHRSVSENIIEACIYHKMYSLDEATKKCDEILKALDIFDQKDKYPNTLSGGQKQRVAIARACILKPQILCFDEPTSALDQASIIQVIDIIKSLSRTMGILIITHDEGFAKTVSTRIVEMQNINNK